MNQLRVVCIEDEPAVIDFIQYVLNKEAIDVLGAIGGAHGLSIIREEKPDLVLLDLMMPGVNGWEVFERMQADPELKPIPVIVVTARSQSMDIARGMDFPNAAAVITKPFFARRLIQVIDRVLHDHLPDVVQRLRSTPAPHPPQPDMLPVRPASVYASEISERLRGRSSCDLMVELDTAPVGTRAGELIIELAIRRRREANLMNATPAQDAFWRNVYHTLASLSLDMAIEKWGQRAPVASALTLNTTEQNTALRGLIDAAETDVRITAISALGRNEVAEAANHLLQHVNDPNQKVRLAVIEALGHIGDNEALFAIMAAIHDESVSVRFAAINALGMLTTPDTIACLRGVLKSDDRGQRIDAIKACVGPDTRMEPDVAVDLLLPIADLEDDSAVLYTLCVALGKLGRSDVVPVLEKLVDHADSHVRTGAHKALEMLRI